LKRRQPRFSRTGCHSNHVANSSRVADHLQYFHSKSRPIELPNILIPRQPLENLTRAITCNASAVFATMAGVLHRAAPRIANRATSACSPQLTPTIRRKAALRCVEPESGHRCHCSDDSDGDGVRRGGRDCNLRSAILPNQVASACRL
jgi:hypothetical protein